MHKPLANKQIVLGITAGIAAYKSAEFLRRLQDLGATVHVAMTPAACQFMTPTTFQALSGRPVFTDTIDTQLQNSMAHINLSRQADAIIVAPASADFMAKLTHGLADDILSTLCLARNCPLIIAPAMNREMWANAATQRNVKQLQADGVHLWGPGYGSQACGEIGSGRMLEPAQLLAESLAFFTPKIMQGLRVLVTAGPTEEAIDPVRVISNKSSGKTGYAIAQAAQRAGAQVQLVSGPTALAQPYGVDFTAVTSARDMYAAVMQRAPQADIFISVAAVADWYIKNASDQKIKKHVVNQLPQLDFAENPDILAQVASLDHGPWCVGFAAETEGLTEYAQAKRKRKNIDLLVGNLVQKVLGQNQTELILYSDAGAEHLAKGDKQEVAPLLINKIMQYYPGRTQEK
ncbi:bifunctional phosphopantothenoylcysteine decarboxylase/phosphopantothenate--cysteine ligase CoaBC [Brackiella oedipodis]|uniref:bifunctional phosphopantothenoylcysteine decarboxylase/phosphopantothenate--cysteine ligase CoaBC n=1 Tax=Brackiella oedipodis TaxID=124225 RepID=UPI00048C5A48|nr:bifunctional phosphopantothenoylcysteine decarboxylase/phosphopantothenate--cysteine ligase CoaBC [Brackiella oedipodis]